MKTPREILLGHHRQAEGKLISARQAALATITNSPERTSISLHDWLRSFRWHAVGLGAAWLVVLMFHMNMNRAPSTMAASPSAKIPSARVIMASLRENRRHLSEIIGAETSAAKSPELFPARPRSERRAEVIAA